MFCLFIFILRLCHFLFVYTPACIYIQPEMLLLRVALKFTSHSCYSSSMLKGQANSSKAEAYKKLNKRLIKNCKALIMRCSLTSKQQNPNTKRVFTYHTFITVYGIPYDSRWYGLTYISPWYSVVLQNEKQTGLWK